MILWFQGTGGGAVLCIVLDLITAEEKEWMSLFFYKPLVQPSVGFQQKKAKTFSFVPTISKIAFPGLALGQRSW